MVCKNLSLNFGMGAMKKTKRYRHTPPIAPFEIPIPFAFEFCQPFPRKEKKCSRIAPQDI